VTITDAIRERVRFVRLPEWDPRASLELPLLPDGRVGPWATIHDFAGQDHLRADGLGETSVFLLDLCHDPESRYAACDGPPRAEGLTE